MTDSHSPMTALVEFQIRTETTDMNTWLEEWQLRADDAFQHEPETTAYEAAVNTEDPSRVLIFERYAGGMSSLDKHLQRPAHKELQANMGERRMTKRRVLGNIGFDIPGYGWWQRPGVAVPLRREGLPLTLLSMRFASDDQRDRFVELSREHGDYCLAAEPDTLVYSGTVAQNEVKPGSSLAQGDLLFIMVCTDDDAVEQHAVDARHVALGEQLARERIDPTHTEILQYRTTGRGFLWR